MNRSIRMVSVTLLIVGCCTITLLPLRGQYVLPSLLDSATIESQLDYIQERTRIYNDFRAVREDIFQKVKKNVTDTLNQARTDLAFTKGLVTERDGRISSLNSDLDAMTVERDEAIRNRDSLKFLGILMNKTLYNTIMWVIVLGLAILALILFLLFRRTHSVTVQTRTELENIQEEFDTYRKNSREKYEKLVVSHHNEIMKLKRS